LATSSGRAQYQPSRLWCRPARFATPVNDGQAVGNGISLSDYGNRAYLAQQGNFVPFGIPTASFNGLVILDTSDIQARRPNPQPKPENARRRLGHL
jgi:hypothetical protein